MLPTRRMGRLCIGSVCALALTLGSSARAQNEGGADAGINVDMNRTSMSGAGVPSSTYGAAADQPGFWNNFLVGGAATINLSGLTGAPTGATLTRVDGGGIQSGCPGGFLNIEFARLMCDYDFAVAGVV